MKTNTAVSAKVAELNGLQILGGEGKGKGKEGQGWGVIAFSFLDRGVPDMILYHIIVSFGL